MDAADKLSKKSSCIQIEVFLARKNKKYEHTRIVKYFKTELDECTEIVSLTKFYEDRVKKELFFAVMFKMQSYLHIGKVSFDFEGIDPDKRKPSLWLA